MNSQPQEIDCRGIEPTEPETLIRQWQELLCSSAQVVVAGGQTKQPRCTIDRTSAVIQSGLLAGIVAYDPQEFIFTARAGTKVADIRALLEAHQQYLPFDPLLVDRGATLGGTVACNASGPGRFRYGGIRDFILGVRFLDGCGRDLNTGGKVVKNAAGFDYPKLMVGSRGSLGILLEITFKVFPKPEKFASMTCSFASLDAAIQGLQRLAASPLDLEAIDLVPDNGPRRKYLLQLRFGGAANAISSRLSRLVHEFPQAEILDDQQARHLWNGVAVFSWAGNDPVIKIPITCGAIPAIEEFCRSRDLRRRYSVAGNVAWIAGPNLEPVMDRWRVRHFFMNAPADLPPQRLHAPGPFAMAIQRALDPKKKFLTL